MNSVRLSSLALALLGTAVGAAAGLALVSGVQDIAASGQVWLPKLSRYGPASDFVPWHQAQTYLLALVLATVGGALAFPGVLQGRRIKTASLCLFAAAAVLMLVHRLPLTLVASVALLLATVALVAMRRARWLAALTGTVSLAMFVYSVL